MGEFNSESRGAYARAFAEGAHARLPLEVWQAISAGAKLEARRVNVAKRPANEAGQIGKMVETRES